MFFINIFTGPGLKDQCPQPLRWVAKRGRIVGAAVENCSFKNKKEKVLEKLALNNLLHLEEPPNAFPKCAIQTISPINFSCFKKTRK